MVKIDKNPTIIPKLTDAQLTSIFSTTNPINIPEEFVYLAKIIDPSGRMFYLNGSEYQSFVTIIKSAPYRERYTIELALNLDRFTEEVLEQTKLIFSQSEGVENNDNGTESSS